MLLRIISFSSVVTPSSTFKHELLKFSKRKEKKNQLNPHCRTLDWCEFFFFLSSTLFSLLFIMKKFVIGKIDFSFDEFVIGFMILVFDRNQKIHYDSISDSIYSLKLKDISCYLLKTQHKCVPIVDCFEQKPISSVRVCVYVFRCVNWWHFKTRKLEFGHFCAQALP